jgi:hypothetical protein
MLLATKYELLVLSAKTEANGQLKYSLTTRINIESPQHEAKKSDDESLKKYLKPYANKSYLLTRLIALEKQLLQLFAFQLLHKRSN